MEQPSNSFVSFFIIYILPLLLICLVFLWLVVLPQRKERKMREQMLASLKRGDWVETVGGIIGCIVDVKDEVITLRVPPSDIKLDIQRSAVNKQTTPANVKKTKQKTS